MDFPSVVVNGEDVADAGQWQHRDSVGLTYMPRSSAEKSALMAGTLVARVPVATNLLDMDGVTNVEVSGITFEQSRWDEPSSDDGFLER